MTPSNRVLTILHKLLAKTEVFTAFRTYVLVTTKNQLRDDCGRGKEPIEVVTLIGSKSSLLIRGTQRVDLIRPDWGLGSVIAALKIVASSLNNKSATPARPHHSVYIDLLRRNKRAVAVHTGYRQNGFEGLGAVRGPAHLLITKTSCRRDYSHRSSHDPDNHGHVVAAQKYKAYRADPFPIATRLRRRVRG